MTNKKPTLAERIEAQQAQSLKELIEWAGSQAVLSGALGVSQQVVGNWVARGRISAVMAAKAEQVTEGAFTKEYMRPDVQVWRVQE